MHALIQQEPEASSSTSIKAPEAVLASWQTMAPFLMASSAALVPQDSQQQLQQQKFFDAFQAAVDQQVGVSERAVCLYLVMLAEPYAFKAVQR